MICAIAGSDAHKMLIVGVDRRSLDRLLAGDGVRLDPRPLEQGPFEAGLLIFEETDGKLRVGLRQAFERAGGSPGMVWEET